MKNVSLKVTLCYQSKSKNYSKLDLLDCVSKSIEIVEKDIGTYNILLDEIEDGNSKINTHNNIIKLIKESNLVIFEISDLNKSIMFELGVAMGINKKILILREENILGRLPYEVHPNQFLSYKKSDLVNFKNQLAGKIKRIILDFKPENILPQESINKILSRYFQSIKTNNEVDEQFNKLIEKTKVNFYYIGTMGFLTKTNDIDWIEKLAQKNPKPKIYRLIFLKDLKEFYELYQNSEVLENYCKWLAKYYIHVKLGNVKLFDCPDVGIWKAGMSITISDEEELIVSTGNFEEFNTKGVWIKNKEIGFFFKEYSKILAAAFSKKINHLDMIKYFNLSSQDKTLNFLKSLPDSVEDEKIERLCIEYVEQYFLEKNE